MATATLSATPRSDVGKGAARKIRAAARTPGVVYGHHREPQPLTIETREFEKLLDRIAGETTIIELSLDGQTLRTLIREVQRHPYKRQILHVDFQELVAGERVTVELPIRIVGTPEGVRNAGGILDQIMHALTVEVDPSNIPNHLDVDVAALGLNESVHVRDLQLPEGVQALADEDATVCVVTP
ncbi:MAG TPA: 50S ribosomal protein L25, partial [Gemmatimonadaceae bacterium]|nr:50S ribosomal protein L25 [Gemmatimonadaceae bacterium]